MVIYYSGTGNSRYVAEAIADRLSDTCICANESIKNRKTEKYTSETPWVFVFPIYVSAMAEPFLKFLERCSFSGCRKAYFVATCASAMGITANEGMELCRAKGLKFMGAEKVVMPQNYIALFTMTKPEEIRRRQKEALRTAGRISRAVKNGRPLNRQQVTPVEKVVTLWIVKLYNRYFTRTKKFFVTGKCVSCGLCQKVCPLDNIRLVNGIPEWNSRCVHCMSCINRCPKKAIEYGKATASKERYVCVKYKKKNTKKEQK